MCRQNHCSIRGISIHFAFLSMTCATYAQDANYEEWYLTTQDSVEIFVKEFRSSATDTVIVIHGGFGANHDYMLDAIAGLEDRFHFILYDQRGSLLSPAPMEKLIFQRNVNDLLELVDELKMRNVKLLCHSMGTLVAMEFARLHPERVDKLVLTGAVVPVATSYHDVFSERMNQQVEVLANRPELVEEQRYYRENRDKLTAKEQTEYWRLSFAGVNSYNLSHWRLFKGGGIYYNAKATVMAETVEWNYDYRSLLDGIVPTVIQGAFDFLDFNAENYLAAVRGYDAIEVLIIPNAGHNSWVDDPELFRKHLIRGLTK